MVTNLHIKNIGIIDDMEIEFKDGLNILTGETGAGKSLIIQAIGIICGERFSKDIIRKGENFSFVEMCIYAPGDINSLDQNIIISREINTSGKNLCKINGRLVTVGELKNFMQNYVEIHGQNENQELLDSKTHKKYLDNFSSSDILKYKLEYKKNYDKYIQIKKKIKENYGDEKEKQRKLDLLKYQNKEISDAHLKENEEEELEQQRKKYMHAEKIIENLKEADNQIGENGIDALSSSIHAFEKIEMLDEKYSNINTELKNIYYEIQEISRDIRDYREEIDFNEENRNETEERLSLIYSLKRKYGNNIKEILEYKRKIENEINIIENSDQYIAKLNNELESIMAEMEVESQNMNKIRTEKAHILSDKINNELKDLEMKNSKVNIRVDYKDEFMEDGKDEIKIFIATNIGEDEHELSKIASGGEMSRIMLAIKKVLSETDNMPVLIFDEIDTGISGKAAQAVGEKLKKISEIHQVLCISHLANIAAKADHHYFISKQIREERTKSSIRELNEEEIIKEIARISSGEINDITLKYANELRGKKVIA